MDGMRTRISIRSAIPPFHRMHGDPVANLDSAARDRPSQRRIGSAEQLAIARNRQAQRVNVILKTRDFLHCSQPQNGECAHTSIARICSLIPGPSRLEGWRKTRPLTNDGMLKILCLDVEVLLVEVCSNSLNNAFANCRRRSECHSRDVICACCFRQFWFPPFCGPQTRPRKKEQCHPLRIRSKSCRFERQTTRRSATF